jgi:hypothetical protein
MLAEDAMIVRCGRSRVLETWRANRDGRTIADPASTETVRTYAGIGFGLPERPANDDHLQGLVAELIWDRLVEERDAWSRGRRIVRKHGVKPDLLEPGGDGLLIFVDSANAFQFRLWEIKKHDSVGRVSKTIRKASVQLAERGHEYLAKLAGPETLEETGDLGQFYGKLIELWIDRSPFAGVGVSVGTSDHHGEGLTKRSFESLNRNFPEFSNPSQTEAIVVAVPEFPDFANQVRKQVWKGL